MAVEGGEYRTTRRQSVTVTVSSTRGGSLTESKGSRHYLNDADNYHHADSYRSRCVATVLQEANIGRGIERLRQLIRRSWRDWAVFRSNYERFDLLTMVRKSLQPTAIVTNRGKGRTHRVLTICVQDGQDATGRTLITNVHQATAGQTREQQRVLDQLAKLTPGRYGASIIVGDFNAASTSLRSGYSTNKAAATQIQRADRRLRTFYNELTKDADHQVAAEMIHGRPYDISTIPLSRLRQASGFKTQQRQYAPC